MGVLRDWANPFGILPALEEAIAFRDALQQQLDFLMERLRRFSAINEQAVVGIKASILDAAPPTAVPGLAYFNNNLTAIASGGQLFVSDGTNWLKVNRLTHVSDLASSAISVTSVTPNYDTIRTLVVPDPHQHLTGMLYAFGNVANTAAVTARLDFSGADTSGPIVDVPAGYSGPFFLMTPFNLENAANTFYFRGRWLAAPGAGTCTGTLQRLSMFY